MHQCLCDVLACTLTLSVFHNAILLRFAFHTSTSLFHIPMCCNSLFECFCLPRIKIIDHANTWCCHWLIMQLPKKLPFASVIKERLRIILQLRLKYFGGFYLIHVCKSFPERIIVSIGVEPFHLQLTFKCEGDNCRGTQRFAFVSKMLARVTFGLVIPLRYGPKRWVIVITCIHFAQVHHRSLSSV